MVSPQAESEQPSCARCGREVRLLNPASDRPRCVGCGYVPELCRCEDALP